MNMISIDTTTEILSVCACSDTEITTIHSESNGHHAGSLISVIEKACDFCGFKTSEINQVVIPEGPGSFTGLRIAYATARAIVLSNNAQLITLPTLTVIASAFTDWNGLVFSVIDAKKNRFYFQAFENGNQITDAIDATVEEIIGLQISKKRILILGPDAKNFSKQLLILHSDADVTTFETCNKGLATELIKFAKLHYSEYTNIIPDHAGPFYLRKSDAEIEISRRKTN